MIVNTHNSLGTACPAVLRGISSAAQLQRQQLAAAAGAVDPVLILAEAGLDAPEVASLVHAARPSREFVALDCEETSTDILTERLFGRPEASARQRRDLEVVGRRSALVTAGCGTLFLANVTEMGAPLQRRLARVLRDGEVYVDDRPQPVATQARLIVSATPGILEDVEAGRFSAALHRRLSVCQIEMVPLRQRPEDIPQIVQALGEELAARHGVAPRAFTTSALTALGSLGWARNLDELRELLERLHAGHSTEAVRQEDVLRALGFGHPNPAPAVTRFDSLRLARQRFEREYIAAVLERHGWRIAEAAATLGIERANLYRKIRQLGLPRPQNGAAGEH